MRYAELTFLIAMVVYHAALLLPRYRRPFALNYVVFLAGMALAWNLGFEGLRWQSLFPTALLLVDLAVLFPSFATLRGRLPGKGFGASLGRVLRSLTASFAFLFAVGCALLAVAFPLPQVELTGGLSVSHRVVRFPATAGVPGMELRLWYPASGDTKTLNRPQAEAEAWQRAQVAGGPPAFWHSYLAHLPTSLIRGGKPASAGARYAVIFVAVPKGQNAVDFGYQLEDLASRGFVVAAGGPLPSPLPPPPPFDFTTALNSLTQPLFHPAQWLEPDRLLDKPESPPDYQWLLPTKRALTQLDAEPGDVLFASLDWSRQGLWVWGSGLSPTSRLQENLGIQGVIHAGGLPSPAHKASRLELWIAKTAVPAAGQRGQWFLGLPSLYRADYSDSAYLKPYLAFFGLKSQPDAGLHGALRQYQAAFYQFALWGPAGDTGFGQTVPTIPGLQLIGR